jgi:hypothetical protein
LINTKAAAALDGIEICGQPAIYLAFTTNCHACLKVMELSTCIGHPTCVEHGAALRTDALTDKHETAVLSRLCTLEATS